MKKDILTLMVVIGVSLVICASSVNSQNLELIGTWTPPALIDFSDLEIVGNYLYVSTYNSGLYILDISNTSNPIIARQITANPFGSANDLFIYNNYAYICNGTPTISIIDISDPVNPLFVNSLTGVNIFTGIWVMGNYAYLNFGGNGITVANIANPMNPFITSTFLGPVGITKLIGKGNYIYTAQQTQIGTFNISNPYNVIPTDSDYTSVVRDLWVNDDYLYNLGSDSLELLNLSNPAGPEFVGTLPIKGTKASIKDSILFLFNSFNPYEIPLSALNVSQPGNPLLMGHLSNTNSTYITYICSRHDTVYVGGSVLKIYRIENINKGWLSGCVKDINNNLPIQGAVVTIPVDKISDTTDASGSFLFRGLYNLNYSLSVSHPLFHSRADTGYTITPGDTSYYTIYIGRSALIDAAVYGMESPPPVMKTDTSYAVRPRVVANCQDTLSFDLTTEVYLLDAETPLLSNTVRIDTLPPGEVRSPEMGSINPVPNTVYKIINFITLPGDQYNPDDIFTYYCTSDSIQVNVWYGNLDGSPIIATLGDTLRIDVFAQTRPDVKFGDLALVFGARDLYIDSLMSHERASVYFPLTTWMDAYFLEPSHSPPNDSGWSSETFWGMVNDMQPDPCETFLAPVKMMTMVMTVVSDTSLYGDTVNAFGPGRHSVFSSSYVGDCWGGPGYPVTEHFCQLIFRPRCPYVLGDVNGDGHSIGGDVTYAVRYFKSQGPPPVDSCYMDSTRSWFYPAGDVNGNCEFRGSDVSRMVAYFKSTATLNYCHFFPPGQTGK